MAKSLMTEFGKIKKLGWNPRKISNVAFTQLCESLQRDKEFLCARGIVIDENNEILGGNQRYTAFQQIHEELQGEKVTDPDWAEIQAGRIPKGWVVKVVKPEGVSDAEWEAKKKRFNLWDNSPEGISGTFDYGIMQEQFGINIMAEAGIDLSNVEGAAGMDDFNKTKEEEAETGVFGEDGEANKDFEDYKKAKQESKEQLEDATDVAYFCVFTFQSYEQKMDFLKKAGLESRYGLYANGKDLAAKMGIELIPDPSDHVFGIRKPEGRLQALAMPLPDDSTLEVKKVGAAAKKEKGKKKGAKAEEEAKDGE